MRTFTPEGSARTLKSFTALRQGERKRPMLELARNGSGYALSGFSPKELAVRRDVRWAGVKWFHEDVPPPPGGTTLLSP